MSRSAVLFDVADTLFNVTPGLDEIPYAGDILQDLTPALKARLFAAFDP
jgi:hypothetical protein